MRSANLRLMPYFNSEFVLQHYLKNCLIVTLDENGKYSSAHQSIGVATFPPCTMKTEQRKCTFVPSANVRRAK